MCIYVQNLNQRLGHSQYGLQNTSCDTQTHETTFLTWDLSQVAMFARSGVEVATKMQ